MSNINSKSSKNIKVSINKTTLLVIVSCFISLLIILLVNFISQKNDQQTNNNNEVVLTQSKIDESVVVNGYDSTISRIESQLQSANSEQKMLLYSQASLLALNNNKLQDAIEYGDKSIAIKPTSQNLSTLGYAYEKTGDFAKAAEYFGKAAEGSPDKSSTGDTEYNYYIQKSAENNSKGQQ